MKTFTHTPVTKAQLVASMTAHRVADRIIQGVYSKVNGTWRGCHIGCSVHDFAPGREDDITAIPELFGVPMGVYRLAERIFEGLPAVEAPDWSLRFTKALPEGADLSRVMPAVQVRIVERRQAALAGLAITDALRSQIGAAMDQVLAVLRTWRDTGTVDTTAATSAHSAAYSAADSASRAAHSAAYSAAYSAYSAAYSAYSAADSADSAAYSAAYSAYSAATGAYSAATSAYSAAYSAARSAAEYRWIADALIEEIERCAPVPA